MTITTISTTDLIEEHLPLVDEVVSRVAVHFPRHVDRTELARAGALGLVEAAQRFDEARGVPFRHFAAQRIRGAIIDSIRATDWAPRRLRTLARRLDQVEQDLAKKMGCMPSAELVAAALDMSVDELHQLRDLLHRSTMVTFDSPAGDSDDALAPSDVLVDDTAIDPADELADRELHAYLRDALDLLPERHRMVAVGYFLEERTSRDLARFLGVTQSRVSQMRTEALEMLRQGIEAQYTDSADSEEPEGLVARRRARYAAAISAASGTHQRISLTDGDMVAA